MRVRPVSAVAFCAASLCASSGCGGSNERAGIILAVKAPLAAFIARDGSALCRAVTPSVASHLVPGDSNCRTDVHSVFDSLRSSIELYSRDERPNELKISAIREDGNLGRATTTWPWPDIHRTVHLKLERSDGRWLISSPTRLVKFITCFKTPEVPCLTSYGIEFGPGPRTVRLASPEEPSSKRQRIEAGSTTPHASLHDELAFSPPVTGGSLGWCVDYRTPHMSSGQCPQTASAVSPILEPSWSSSAPPPVTQGFVLTTSAVAAVSVNGSRAIPTRAAVADPDGLRAVLVEFASFGRRLFGRLPRVVALSAAGNPVKRSEPTVRYPDYGLEGVFWQRPSRPPRGACILTSYQFPGLIPEWGHVVPKIRSFTDLLPPALLSCIDTEYYLNNWPLDAAVVLNHPILGLTLNSYTTSSACQVIQVCLETAGWTGQVARRTGNAWIVVEGGNGLKQRLTVLEHLRASIHL